MNQQNGRDPVNEITRTDNQQSNASLPALSSINLSSDMGHTVHSHTSESKLPRRSMTSVQKNSYNPSIESSSSFTGYRDMHGRSKNYVECHEQEPYGVSKEDKKKKNNPEYIKDEPMDKLTHASPERKDIETQAPTFKGIDFASMEANEKKEEQSFRQDEQFLGEKRLFSDYKSVDKFSQGGFRRLGTMGGLTSTRNAPGVQVSNGRLKHVKSQLCNSAGRSGYLGNSRETEIVTKVPLSKTASKSAKTIQETENKEIAGGVPNANGKSGTENHKEELSNEFYDYKVESESRIQMLEEELREAATLEIGLYSVVTEHGSSVNKVHAPARRLSRFYLHACKEKSRAKQASAARAAISGLVLVSKACGNDVPRYILVP